MGMGHKNDRIGELNSFLLLTFPDLSMALKQSDRFMALSHFYTPSISSFLNLDIEATKFYDRSHPHYDAALLTRCYTQHALFLPYIDSKINHIRYSIKIQFVNKGIEYIISSSILFKDKKLFSYLF